MQSRAGLREQANDLLGMYRDALPGTVAAFLAEHTFAALSSADVDGNLWASPLAGAPGIFSVPDEHSLAIHLDRLSPAIEPDLVHGNLAGLLVIHFNQRLRLRINGSITRAAETLTLRIGQLYGNCSKYIQRRVPGEVSPGADRPPVLASAGLSEAQRDWIRRSDTFFIATRHAESGADASHRGGRPGFVSAPDERTIVFPDYRGNNMFNTLGNLELDARAGLLFIDFDTGASLQVTGSAVAEWKDPDVGAPTGRRVRFHVTGVRELQPAAALRYSLVERFPYNPPVE